jgi:hypothetical protein
MYKKVLVFDKLLRAFCADKGIRFVQQLDLGMLQEWRSTWKVAALSRKKRQGQVIGFIWFCERAGWFPHNYAHEITTGLGKIQAKAVQTGYFSAAPVQGDHRRDVPLH